MGRIRASPTPCRTRFRSWVHSAASRIQADGVDPQRIDPAGRNSIHGRSATGTRRAMLTTPNSYNLSGNGGFGADPFPGGGV